MLVACVVSPVIGVGAAMDGGITELAGISGLDAAAVVGCNGLDAGSIEAGTDATVEVGVV